MSDDTDPIEKQLQLDLARNDANDFYMDKAHNRQMAFQLAALRRLCRDVLESKLLATLVEVNECDEEVETEKSSSIRRRLSAAAEGREVT